MSNLVKRFEEFAYYGPGAPLTSFLTARPGNRPLKSAGVDLVIEEILENTVEVYTKRCPCQHIAQFIKNKQDNLEFQRIGALQCKKLCKDKRHYYLPPSKFGSYNRFVFRQNLEKRVEERKKENNEKNAQKIETIMKKGTVELIKQKVAAKAGKLTHSLKIKKSINQVRSLIKSLADFAKKFLKKSSSQNSVHSKPKHQDKRSNSDISNQNKKQTGEKKESPKKRYEDNRSRKNKEKDRRKHQEEIRRKQQDDENRRKHQQDENKRKNQENRKYQDDDDDRREYPKRAKEGLKNGARR